MTEDKDRSLSILKMGAGEEQALKRMGDWSSVRGWRGKGVEQRKQDECK